MNLLKTERKLKKITQREMAERTHIPFKRYCAIEKGYVNALSDEHKAIRRVLNAIPTPRTQRGSINAQSEAELKLTHWNNAVRGKQS